MTQPQDKMRAEFEELRPDFESLPMFDIDRTLLQKDAEGDYVYEPVQGMWIGYGLAHAYPSAQSQQDALDAARYLRIRNGPHSDNYGDLYAMSFQGDGDIVVKGERLDDFADAAIAAQGASNV